MNLTPIPVLLQAVLALMATVAAVFDLRFRRIPNWLTISGLAVGLAGGNWRHALLGIGLALAVYLPLYSLRAVGAGDVKLMAAIGSIAGPGNWLFIFAGSAVLGGIFALGLVVWHGKLGATLGNVGVILMSLLHLRAPHSVNPQIDVGNPLALRLPHGISIAVAVLLFLLLHGK